jgi:hypothetical protein
LQLIVELSFASIEILSFKNVFLNRRCHGVASIWASSACQRCSVFIEVRYSSPLRQVNIFGIDSTLCCLRIWSWKIFYLPVLQFVVLNCSLVIWKDFYLGLGISDLLFINGFFVNWFSFKCESGLLDFVDLESYNFPCTLLSAWSLQSCIAVEELNWTLNCSWRKFWVHLLCFICFIFIPRTKTRCTALLIWILKRKHWCNQFILIMWGCKRGGNLYWRPVWLWSSIHRATFL